MKLLLVEDDSEIREMLTQFLESEHFEMTEAETGRKALEFFHTQPFDLVLLDLMLPDIGGLHVLRHIREKSTVPVLIISAKDTDSDVTLGLGLGADGYIAKPFSLVQLLAHIKAVLRRAGEYQNPTSSPEDSQQPVSFGPLALNPQDYTLHKNGLSIPLTGKEFEILRLLMQHPGKVYTKEQIYRLVWNEPYLGDENAVNVHISRLRNKIEDNPRSPRFLLTVWGIGYKMGGTP